MQIKIKPSLAAPLLVLVMYILMAVSNFADISLLNQRDNIFLAVIILQAVIFIIPGILYCRLRGSSFIPNIRFKMFGKGTLWITISSFFLLTFGSALIKVGLYSIGYYSQRYTLYEKYLPNDASSLINVLYIIIAIAIMPAITEEFVFRGIVLGEYSSSGMGKNQSVFLSALLFAMLHFNIYQLPVYLFGGIVMGYVTLMTDSVLCAMALHLLSNIFSLLFEPQLLRLISQTDSIIFVLFILTIGFLVCMIFTFRNAEVMFYHKGINGDPSPRGVGNKKKKNKTRAADIKALLSPAFIACVIVFFVATFALK